MAETEDEKLKKWFAEIVNDLYQKIEEAYKEWKKDLRKRLGSD